jgi:hypothetical protein
MKLFNETLLMVSFKFLILDTMIHSQVKTSDIQLNQKSSSFDFFRYLHRCTFRLILKLTPFSIFSKRKGAVWNIAWAKSEIDKLDDADFHIVDSGDKYSFADPFLFNWNGKLFVFIEKIDKDSGLGRIAFGSYIDGTFQEFNDCLVEDFHLSFPFIFEYGNEVFMCPETSNKLEIRLYRAVSFPTKWEYYTTLLAGKKFVDTIIYRVEDEWVLQTSYSLLGSMGTVSEVYEFKGTSPISNDWLLQPPNQITFDSLNGRNGGFVQNKGKLFRLGQRFVHSTYGYGVTMNSVTRDSQNNYLEKPFLEITPVAESKIAGVHHVSTANEFVFIDFKAPASMTPKQNLRGQFSFHYFKD